MPSAWQVASSVLAKISVASGSKADWSLRLEVMAAIGASFQTSSENCRLNRNNGTWFQSKGNRLDREEERMSRTGQSAGPLSAHDPCEPAKRAECSASIALPQTRAVQISKGLVRSQVE